MSYKYFFIGGFTGIVVAYMIYFIVIFFIPVSGVFCLVLGFVCAYIGSLIGMRYD